MNGKPIPESHQFRGELRHLLAGHTRGGNPSIIPDTCQEKSEGLKSMIIFGYLSLDKQPG